MLKGTAVKCKQDYFLLISPAIFIKGLQKGGCLKQISRRQWFGLFLSSTGSICMNAFAGSQVGSLFMDTRRFCLFTIQSQANKQMTWSENMQHHQSMMDNGAFMALLQDFQDHQLLLGHKMSFDGATTTWNYLFRDKAAYLEWDRRRRETCPVDENYLEGQFKFTPSVRTVSRQELVQANLSDLFYT